jgi:methyl-accepting chemotaxis protein
VSTSGPGSSVDALVAEYEDLQVRLADPAVHADQSVSRRLGRRYAELTPIIATARDLDTTRGDLTAARELSEEDAAFADEARELAARVAEISGAVEEISAETERAQLEVADVAAVAEESSASAEQVSASTEETSASAQEIAASAQTLSATADQLNGLVRRFKVTA